MLLQNGCAQTTDGDGVTDDVDNCIAVVNPDQADGDGNGLGNECRRSFVDLDPDGNKDEIDNCPLPNSDQIDGDRWVWRRL